MAGLVPAIPPMDANFLPTQGRRDKAGDDKRSVPHPCALSGLPPTVTGFAAMSVNAITQGSVPLFTQLWMVPLFPLSYPNFH